MPSLAYRQQPRICRVVLKQVVIRNVTDALPDSTTAFEDCHVDR
jgi:hypothetical protein